jgi:hypothetical protein
VIAIVLGVTLCVVLAIVWLVLAFRDTDRKVTGVLRDLDRRVDEDPGRHLEGANGENGENNGA